MEEDELVIVTEDIETLMIADTSSLEGEVDSVGEANIKVVVDEVKEEVDEVKEEVDEVKEEVDEVKEEVDEDEVLSFSALTAFSKDSITFFWSAITSLCSDIIS